MWQKGQSGNPGGRSPGTGEVARLRAQIAEHLPEIIEKQVELAKGGDSQAARLLLERVIPPMRPVEGAAPIDMVEGSLTEQGRAVFAALASGALAPTQGAAVITALGGLAKIMETDELARRVAALEERKA